MNPNLNNVLWIIAAVIIVLCGLVYLIQNVEV